jgi:hypothetical protein
MFDALVDEMRAHTTGWLEARRAEVVLEIRRLQSEEHAVLLVLDERGRVDVSRVSMVSRRAPSRIAVAQEASGGVAS